jgi:BirA family transcriptional regulator, biotin operon repressor / biotin---[acetyl-CoA-carboxylase] ligase
MSLSKANLENELPDRPVRFYPSVESTQDLALQWLREGAEAGAVVIADEQRKGRGRHGRFWYTPPGVALALSVILRPPVKVLHQVTMLGALSIYDMLGNLGADAVTIKWPNDVRLQGRKVSGVLPEAEWDGGKLRGVTLGIGVNVRVDFSGTEVEETAISIEPALGHPIDRTEAIALLLRHIDHWALRLGTPEIFDTWKARLETIGQRVTIGEVSGIAEAVDREGALFVRTATGERVRVLAGDVALG